MGVIIEHSFTFAGKSSQDFGVWISGSGTFNAPARDVETLSIPGRNGDLTHDNGRFSNITVSYPAFISWRFQPRIDSFRAFLASQVGYQRLEDSYHPEEFRLAMYRSGLEVSPTARNLAGSFNIQFDCKPQRYLKDGERQRTLTGSGTLRNPTDFPALPLIRAFGTGDFTINGIKVTISSADEYTDIDSDLQDAYKGTANCNGNIVLDNEIFPELVPGNNEISMSGVTQLIITPRWWTI